MIQVLLVEKGNGEKAAVCGKATDSPVDDSVVRTLVPENCWWGIAMITARATEKSAWILTLDEGDACHGQP